MRATRTLAVAGLLALAGCGESSRPDDASERGNATVERRAAGDEEPAKRAAAGTEVTARRSDFGPMLFGPGRRAIYIFERDSKDTTRCYGECAEEWPPVLTKAKPRARAGARASLLGTVERRDGQTQVTYAGRPLYYYAHEGPGEVRCHNVDLNGGFWWVIGPDGDRRP